MGDRTFPDAYRDTRVKRPDFPLADAINWFLADYAAEVEPTTLDTYRSHLRLFCSWLPEDHRTLQRLEPETVERWLRGTANRHTRMNKTIALKSFAKYLARQRVWYAGTEDARSSVHASSEVSVLASTSALFVPWTTLHLNSGRI